MDMSGMEGMGMDMSSDGMFKGTNMHIARTYWYIAAAIVALLALRRGIDQTRTRLEVTQRPRNSGPVYSRKQNFLVQGYDTLIAMCREAAYPQVWWLSGPMSKYFNPPALGRCLFLTMYWIVILTMLWTNTILSPSSPMYAYKWEIVGFRAAWVSVTQLPLIYLLGGKINLVSTITGISYERLNWLHRWVARTLFLTVIVHWSFFFREWWIADFVKLELQMMPMVKYGFGSWAVLGWMVLTGFGFFRQLSYEFFVLQHIASFTVLLWLVYSHVPSYARYNVWLSIAFLVLDRGSRIVLLLLRNIQLGSKSSVVNQKYVLGYSAEMEVQTGGYVLLTIKNLRFSWKAGQHIFISIPRCGILQSHPFTISNLPNHSNNVRILLKARSGFTRNLLRHAEKCPNRDVRTLVSSPYGSPPLNAIAGSDSLILIATSTGASFTVPIMQNAINKTTTIARVRMYWIIRDASQIENFSSEISSSVYTARAKGIDIFVQVYITCQDYDRALHLASEAASSIFGSAADMTQDEKHLPQSDTSVRLPENPPANKVNTCRPVPTQRSFSYTASHTQSLSSSSLMEHDAKIPATISLSSGRPPSLDTLIRPTIEESDGATSIIACGAASLMAELRNYTAFLSDERAVHKGTGAPGIFLFTETYGW